MHPKLDDPLVKRVGALALCLLIGFAVGNGHATKAAVDGSASWWKQQEATDIKKHSKAAWDQCIKYYGW